MVTSPSRRRSPRSSKSARIRALLSTGKSVSEIAKEVGCSTNLVYVVRSSSRGGGGAPRRRGPGRPPKTTAAGDGLEGILAAVKNSERDRESMRAALQRIRGIIDEALA